MDEYCRFFGCQEKPTIVIDSWHYCNKHAKIARQGLAHQHNRSKVIDNITDGLTLEELQSLSPDKVRASNDLYEALKIALWAEEHGEAEAQKQGTPRLMERLEIYSQALSRADGGK